MGLMWKKKEISFRGCGKSVFLREQREENRAYGKGQMSSKADVKECDFFLKDKTLISDV